MPRRLHSSWLISLFAFGVLGGIALSAAWHPVIDGGWIAAACFICTLACIKRTRACIVIVLATGVLIGTWRGGVAQLALRQYQPLYTKTVTLQGVVTDDAAYGPSGDQRLTLGDIRINGTAYAGQVWISSDISSAIKRSDTVVLRGTLGAGFGSLAASMFHATVVHITRPDQADIGLAVRDWFARGIHVAIPSPQAELASGYLVGQRSALPSDLDSQLKTVGLTHAVVASGYNLTILVSFARQLLLGTSKYLATLSAAGMVAGFIAISGASPSMARAGLVTSLSLAAWYYGRRIHPMVLLPLAAAATAWCNPFYVWGDIGWYLSFASFAGVIILAPLLQAVFWSGRGKPGWAAQLLTDTISAQITTMPIMIFAFGHYSIYALPANLLVLPLVPITMLLTFIGGIAGLIGPSMGHLVGLPANLLLHYMTTVVHIIADLPGAQGELNISTTVLVGCYAAIVIAMVALWRRTRLNFRRSAATLELD